MSEPGAPLQVRFDASLRDAAARVVNPHLWGSPDSPKEGSGTAVEPVGYGDRPRMGHGGPVVFSSSSEGGASAVRTAETAAGVPAAS